MNKNAQAFNASGALLLDLCLTKDDELKGETVYLLFDVIIDYLNENYQENSTIKVLGGNDTIFNRAGNVTIDSGAGDDKIQNSYSTVTIKSGEGNDFIRGFRENSTLEIVEANYTTKSGNNIIVTVGKNKVTLEGAAALKTVNIVEPSDSINNRAKGKNITTNNGDDTINNSGTNVTINARGGNNSINNDGNSSTINGGRGR